MRAYTQYQGYQEGDAFLDRFWAVVDSLSEDEKGRFLMFATGCSRPPLLGFRHLSPHFAVHRYTLDNQQEMRLLTASTCVNMLTVPNYEDEERLRECILRSIYSNEGFNFA